MSIEKENLANFERSIENHLNNSVLLNSLLESSAKDIKEGFSKNRLDITLGSVNFIDKDSLLKVSFKPTKKYNKVVSNNLTGKIDRINLNFRVFADNAPEISDDYLVQLSSVLSVQVLYKLKSDNEQKAKIVSGRSIIKAHENEPYAHLRLLPTLQRIQAILAHHLAEKRLITQDTQAEFYLID